MSLSNYALALPIINVLNPIIKIQRPSDVSNIVIPNDTESTLPNFGDPSGQTSSSYQEHQMGKSFIRYVRNTMPILNDSIVNEYLNQLGYRLVAASPNPSQHYDFFVINRDDINAFSGPDGYVGVYSGLILETKTEAELAAVLAHEIAHVSQHHIVQLAADAKRTELASLGALVASIAVGVANPLAGIGMVAASQAGGSQHMIDFMRQHEKEADRIGIQILAKAGFDPRNMPRFFERMARHDALNSDETPAILQTHPVTEARLSDAYNRCTSYPIYPNRLDPVFPLIQARVAVELHQDTESLLQQYHQALSDSHQKLTRARKTYLTYAYALALLKAERFDQSNLFVRWLVQQYPRELLFKMTEVDNDIAQQNYREALVKARMLYHDYPDSFPVVMQYATILLRLKQYSSARVFLEPYQRKYGDHTSYLSLLSQAQGFSGRKSQAYETRSQICLIQGNSSCAREQLNMANQFVPNKDEKRRIQAKLKAL